MRANDTASSITHAAANAAKDAAAVQGKEAVVSPSARCRILGGIWLCSLFVYLFLGTTTFAGGTPPLISAICVIASISWIVSSLSFVIIFVRSILLSRSNKPVASRPAIVRWFVSVASGLVGGVAAHQVNHLFPGEWTRHSDWLPGMLLFGLVGMLVGATPLVLPLKPRTTAVLALILSGAFSWWIIVNIFR